MNNKNVLIGGGVVLALAMSVFALLSGGQDGMPGTPGTPGTPGLGATPGTDFQERISIGGSVIYGYSTKINAASGTAACQFRSPPATTTLPLDGLRVNADTATGTHQWYANFFGNNNTTPLGTYSTSTGSLGTATAGVGGTFSPVYIGSSTPGNMTAQNGGRVLPPNSIINVGFAGITNSQSGGFNWGNCQLLIYGAEL